MSEVLLPEWQSRPLNVDAVLELQRVVMAQIRPLAKRVNINPDTGRHQFVVSQEVALNDEQQLSDISLLASIGKLDAGYFRQWGMRLVLTERTIPDVQQFTVCRETYAIDWSSDGQCDGTKTVYTSHGRVVDEWSNAENRVIEVAQAVWGEMTYPVEGSDCRQLGRRLLEFAGITAVDRAA